MIASSLPNSSRFTRASLLSTKEAVSLVMAVWTACSAFTVDDALPRHVFLH